MEDNKYDRTLYLRRKLYKQLFDAKNTCYKMVREAPRLYANFKNKEIGELLDELLQLDGEFLRTYDEIDQINDGIKYNYKIWSSYIMNLKKKDHCRIYL